MADAGRITVDELHDKLEQGDQITIVDVRRSSWDRSDEQIEGAVRLDPDRYADQLDALAPGASVATYCT